MDKQKKTSIASNDITEEMLRWFSERIKSKHGSFDLLASIQSAAKLPPGCPWFNFFFSPDMKEIWQKKIGAKDSEKLRIFAWGFLLADLTFVATSRLPTRHEDEKRKIIEKLLKRIKRDAAFKKALADSVCETIRAAKYLPPLPKGTDAKFHQWKLKLTNSDAIDLLQRWRNNFLKDVSSPSKRQKTNGGAIQDAIDSMKESRQGLGEDFQFRWALEESLEHLFFADQGNPPQNFDRLVYLLESWGHIYGANFKDRTVEELAQLHISRKIKSKEGHKGFWERHIAGMIKQTFGLDNATLTSKIYNAIFDDIKLYGESFPDSVKKSKKALKKPVS